MIVPGDEDRGDVGEEEQQGPPREVEAPGAEGDADDGEHGDQRDGDRHAGEDVGHVAAGQRERAGDAGRDGDDEVEQPTAPSGPTICGLASSGMRWRGERPTTTPMSDVDDDAAHEQGQRGAQVAPASR